MVDDDDDVLFLLLFYPKNFPLKFGVVTTKPIFKIISKNSLFGTYFADTTSVFKTTTIRLLMNDKVNP